MADLKLKVSIKEKNERGQEVELVCKTIQFKPQVSAIYMFVPHGGRGGSAGRFPVSSAVCKLIFFKKGVAHDFDLKIGSGNLQTNRTPPA